MMFRRTYRSWCVMLLAVAGTTMLGVDGQRAMVRGSLWKNNFVQTLTADESKSRQQFGGRLFDTTKGLTAYVRSFQADVAKRTESIVQDFKSVFPEDYEPAGPDPNFEPIFAEDYTPPPPNAYEDKFKPIFDTTPSEKETALSQQTGASGPASVFGSSSGAN